MDVGKRRSRRVQTVVASVQGQHGENLAGAKSDGDIDDPDEAIGEGIGAQGGVGRAGTSWSRAMESLVTQLITV